MFTFPRLTTQYSLTYQVALNENFDKRTKPTTVTGGWWKIQATIHGASKGAKDSNGTLIILDYKEI